MATVIVECISRGTCIDYRFSGNVTCISWLYTKSLSLVVDYKMQLILIFTEMLLNTVLVSLNILKKNRSAAYCHLFATKE